MEQAVTEALRYALELLPWWQAALLALAVGLVLALAKRVKVSVPPVAGPPPESPPMPLNKDGTLHLNQTPPKDYL